MKLPWICATGLMMLSGLVAPLTARSQEPSRDMFKPLGRALNIRTLAFSSDGRLLAAGAGETEKKGQLVVWERKTLKRLFVHEVEKGVPMVAFSHDHKTLAVGSFTEHCQLLEADTGKVQATLSGHGKSVRSVAFAPDGNTLAVGSYDHSIRLWNYRTGQLLKTLQGHSNWVYCVAYTPDGKTLASFSADNSVRLWDAASGKLLRTWKDYGSIVRCVAFDPTGQCLVTPCWDGTLKLRDHQQNKLLGNFSRDRAADWAAIHPSGKMLAVGFMNASVQLFPVDNQQATPEQQKQIQELIALWDDDRFAVREQASQDLRKFGLRAEPFLTQAIKETKSAEVRLRARQVRATIRSPQPTATLQGHHDQVLWGAYSGDGQLLATAGRDGMVLLWDAATHKIKATLAWP